MSKTNVVNSQVSENEVITSSKNNKPVANEPKPKNEPKVKKVITIGCTRCFQAKPLESFGIDVHNKKRHGKQAMCNHCVKVHHAPTVIHFQYVTSAKTMVYNGKLTKKPSKVAESEFITKRLNIAAAALVKTGAFETVDKAKKAFKLEKVEKVKWAFKGTGKVNL